MPTLIHLIKKRTPFIAIFGLVFLCAFLFSTPGAHADITSNLILRYTFDDNAANTTVTDSTGNGHTGTASANTSTFSVPGKFATAFQFSTTSQRYVETNYAWSASDPDFTMSMWVKTTFTGDNYPVISDYGGQLGFFGLNTDNAGRPVIAVYDTSGNNATAQALSSITDGRWHFLAATLASTTLSLYIDGSLAATGSNSAFTGNYRDIFSDTLKIGKSGSSDYFPGTIDDVRIYNRALSSTEVSTLGGLDMNLFGWWKFDDGSGSTAIDSSGNGDTGTLVNSPTWVAGKIGSNALSFTSGNHTYVSTPNFISGSGLSLSFSAWVYPTSYDNPANSIIQGTNNASGIDINSSGQLEFTDRTPAVHTYTGATIPLNQWTFVAVVCTTDVAGGDANDTVTMYINGSQVKQDTGASECANNFSNESYYIGTLGFSAGNYGWTGYLDDVRLYDERALSSSDVSALYALGVTSLPPTAISSISISTTTTTATITWSTDQTASSTINYGLTSGYGSASTTDTFVSSHQIILSNLSPGTQYHYQVASGNTNGVSTSSDLTFVTAPDTTPPNINTIASSTLQTTATVTWNTDEPATSKVAYGTVSGTYTLSSTSPAFVTNHSIGLTGLAGGTKYFYVVVSADSSGNISTSSEKTLLTTALADTTPPNISSIAVTTGTSTATITWSTDEPATSIIKYGLNSSYGFVSSSASLVSNHSVTLNFLSASTTYHFQIGSADSSGNLGTSSDQTFTVASTSVFYFCGGGYCAAFHQGDVVAMVGDSISSINLYTAYLESWWYLHYPNMRIHFRDISRSGAAIPNYTGGGQYMGQVDPLAPNTVILMMTNNGGFTEGQYISQVDDIINNYIIASSSAQPLIFDVPPMNTADGSSLLGQYSSGLQTFSLDNHIAFAGPIWSSLHTIWANNLASSSPVDIQDGGDTDHMGPPAHLGIAYAYLNAANTDPDVSSTTIDASTATVVSEQDAVVTNVATTSQGIDFTRLDARLPMAYDDRSLPIFEIMPQIYDQDKYMLTISGLSSGDYYVNIDGTPSGSASSAELASGWNMSTMTSGPIHDQLQDVLDKIRTKVGLDRVTRAVLSPNTGVVEYLSIANSCYIDQGLTGAALKSCVAGAVSDMNTLDNAIYTAAQPTSHTFSLVKASGSADVTPASIFNPSPGATVAQGTTQTTLSVQTDEAATCKYDTTAQTPYIWMHNTFTTTGGTTHSATISGLLDGVTYTYYIRCQDAFGNRNMSDYTLTFSVNADPNPIAYWNFDDGSGSTAADSSGNSHTATFTGSLSWVAGKVGSHALLFDGTTNAGTVGDISDADGIGALTITAWVKGPGNFVNGNGYSIISKYASGQGPWTFAYTGASHVYDCTIVNSSGANATALGPTIQLNDANWHLVACVYNGTNITVYTDGATSTNPSDSPALTGVIKDTTYPVCIGTISDGVNGCQSNIAGMWSGTIDDLRIYKRALSATEIQDLFNQTAPVISNVATSTTPTTATITWDTDESASSTINYGSTSSYGQASTSDTFVTSHSITLTGLTASTLYHFQAASQDAFGKVGTSSDMTFTTTATVDTTPPVISSIASSTGANTATITWDTDESASSTVLYGLTSGYGNASSSAAFVTTGHTILLSGLTGSTVYHFKVASADASGNVSNSSDLTFTTAADQAAAPSVTTTPSPSPISTSTATIAGSISNTHGFDASQSGFAYGTASDLHTVISTSTLGAQTGTASFSLPLTGLTPNTTYYYRAYAINIQGTGYGAIQSFVTLAISKPTVTTVTPSSVTDTTAVGNGTITSTGNIDPTLRGIVYGTTSAYGATTSDSGIFSTGNFSENISGLACNTLYHVAAFASNTQGIGYGNDLTFTPPCLSSVALISSNSVGPTSATVTWTSDEPASSKIDLGIDNTYGSSTPEFDTSPRVASHSVTISPLLACTTYHYRVRSKDAAATEVISADRTLTTSGCTASASVATSSDAVITTSSSGTLNGLSTDGSGITLTVPTSFSSSTSQASFQAKRLDVGTFLGSVSAPSGLSIVGSNLYNLEAVSNLTTSLHFFDQPLTVSITYTDADIAHVDTSTLTIKRYDGSSWVDLADCTTSLSTKTVTCTTDRFSDFALFGTVIPSAPSTSSTSSTGSSSGGGGGYNPFAIIQQILMPTPKPPVATTTTNILQLVKSPLSLANVFTRNLYLGMSGNDVRQLQIFLNIHGFTVAKTGSGSKGHETMYFGPATQAAVKKFQSFYAKQVLAPSGLKAPTGTFGPASRAQAIWISLGNK